MSEWKKVVLVIKEEDLLFRDGKLSRTDISLAWYRYLEQLGIYPSVFEAYWLESKDKKFKKTWHVTVKFRKRWELVGR